MQVAASVIAFPTALESSSAATTIAAATKASNKAYSTEEMPLASLQSLARNCFIPYMGVSLRPK